MRLSNMTRGLPPVWIMALLALALWGGEFARRDLWEPDEARYAYVAREMRDGGHWLVPHINGQPYPDKPPLMFWLINASSLLTAGRINSVSARLPSLLGSLLTLWAATRLLARWHSPEAAWRAMLILPTAFLFWQEGGWGRIDALLCGLVMMSLYCFFTSIEPGRRTRRELLGYVFAGLAVLAKGPVGLAVPMGVFAVGTLASGDAKALRRSHWLWGPVVALTIPALWLLAAWLEHPPAEYFASMFGEKSFGRVIESRGHDRPFFYFLWHFPVEFLPWSIFGPVSIYALSHTALKRRLLGWIAFVIALFSLFVCKRNVYVLAAYPAAAMLVAAAWDDVAGLRNRWCTVSGVIGIGLVWFMAVASAAALFVPTLPFSRLLLLPSIAALGIGAWVLTCVFRKEALSHRFLFTLCGAFLAFQVTVTAVVLPGLNPVKQPGLAAREVRDRVPPGEPVYLYAQQLATFPLYAQRPGREIHTMEDLRRVIAGEKQAVVVFHEKQWEEMRGSLPDAVASNSFTVGHKRLVWVEFSTGATHGP